MPAPSPRLRPAGSENGAIFPREMTRMALNPAMTAIDTVSEPPATTRSSSPLRIRSAPIPTAELELEQAEETVITRPLAPLMRLMTDVQWETSVAATSLGRIRSHRLPSTYPATSSVRTSPAWELPRHTPIRSGATARGSTPACPIASRYASTVISVARSIHDHACVSTSTGRSSSKLLARSPMNRLVSKRVTFEIESRPSSSARFNCEQSRPSGENAPIPMTTASWPRCVVGRVVGRVSSDTPRAPRSALPAVAGPPVPSHASRSASPSRSRSGSGRVTPETTRRTLRSKPPFNAGTPRRHAGPRRCSTTMHWMRETRPPRRSRPDLPSGAEGWHR